MKAKHRTRCSTSSGNRRYCHPSPGRTVVSTDGGKALGEIRSYPGLIGYSVTLADGAWRGFAPTYAEARDRLFHQP